MTSNTKPIGFFDSGVGGTSIWKAVQERLPFENTVYIADSVHAPYGERSKEEILTLSRNNTSYLLNKGCKLVVVACNTATTNAIAHLRMEFKVPFVGIEPAIKPAALQSKTGKIGLLATRGTLGSAMFHQSVLDYTAGVTLVEQEGLGLVSLIEQGKAGSKEAYALLVKYLTPMVAKGIDTLVLGCTHYPYLLESIKKILPPHIKVLDAAHAVAVQTQHLLIEHGLTNHSNTTATHAFYTNKALGLLKGFIPDGKKGATAFYAPLF